VTAVETRPATKVGVAQTLAEALRPFVGGDLPVRLHAWDGSVAGPQDAPVVRLNSAQALTRLLWAPGELGAAQAYVTGEIDVDGDLDTALTHVWAVIGQRGLTGVSATPGTVWRAARAALRVGALGRRPAAPVSQAVLRGRLHSRTRDRAAISHHYDFSNEFYDAILDDTMAYSSGYYRSPETTLGQAQEAKLELICRKLGLGAGSTFLDVGCGWGSLSLYAAEHFDAQVTGITIAAEQKKFIDARIAARGLADRVEIKLCDYRDASGEHDAVASIEMGEHVGQDNYPTYAGMLHRSVKPGGRVLVQQMSRSGKWPGGGPFIENFIAPDMYMRPVAETLAFFERAGLEVRDVHALREHYVLTVAGWLENFHRHRERLVELVGEEVVRVWELYLVGGSMAFRDGRMGVDQIVMVRPGAGHSLPMVRDW